VPRSRLTASSSISSTSTAFFVYPVIVGGDKPFFPSTDASLELELVETLSFASRVIYLRYQRFGENEAARPTSGALEPCQLERSSISAFSLNGLGLSTPFVVASRDAHFSFGARAAHHLR
jgi:hypothetical protein